MQTFNYSVLIMSLCLLASIGCGGNKQEEAQKAKADSLSTAPLQVNQVVGICNIEPVKHTLSLNTESSGLVESILADAGATVKKGDVIVVLSHNAEEAQTQQAAGKRATQQAAIDQSTAAVKTAQVRALDARRNHDRDKKLFAEHAITQQQLDASETLMNTTQRELEVSEAALKQSQTKLNEMQADLNYAEALLAKKYVKAPEDGLVLSMDARLGEILTPEKSIGEFAPSGAIMAVTEVDELFATRITGGERAFVRMQGSTEQLAEGTVIFASPYLKKKSLFSDSAKNLEDRRIREVHVQLNDASRVLLGSRLECVIELK
jgi:multidrug efflux pump subunit AcrA (membrane-fusion protein)